jgi:hypothetical protein
LSHEIETTSSKGTLMSELAAPDTGTAEPMAFPLPRTCPFSGPEGHDRLPVTW